MERSTIALNPLLARQEEPARPTAAGAGGDCATLPARPLVGVVRNPRSHRNKGLPAELVDHPDVITVEPATRDELAEALREFAERQVDLIVVDGGDGTVRDLLTRGARAFGSRWPRLMILPKGKTNALAVDLGMPGKWSLSQALGVTGAFHVVRRRPIVVERPDGEAFQAMGFIMGAGVLNAAIDAGQVAHRYGAFQSFAVGVTAAFAVLKALFGLGEGPWRALAPMRVFGGCDRAEVPQSEHGVPGLRYASGFSTLDRFPLGMRPFGREQGGIRYLVADRPLRRVMALAPAILMGLDRPFLRRLGVHRGAADEIALQLGERFILDGESFPPGSYRLRLGPELEFLVP